MSDAFELYQALALDFLQDLTSFFELLFAVPEGAIAAVEGFLLAVEVFVSCGDALF